jgi:uncharacterized membrane protein
MEQAEGEPMTQDEINRAEWENPANWSGGLLGVYFSKRDSRVWVPKRNPAMGWTLNFANPRSTLWLAGLIAGPALIAAIVMQLARR